MLALARLPGEDSSRPRRVAFGGPLLLGSGAPVSCSATFVRWIAALAIFSMLGWAGEARAESFDLGDTGWEGARGLVELAEHELGPGRVEATNRLDWQRLSPADGVLFLHPLGGPDPDEVAAFLRAGGRVAVVDDYGDGERLLARAPYRIRKVPPPSSPLAALRGNPNLPLAEPVSESMAGRRMSVHPVVAEVGRVALNHPVGFTHPDLTSVLRVRALGEPDVTVAVAGQVGRGRIFALGDPSALINQMLRYQGNRALAVGVVRYLVADDETSGPRHGKLVLVANRFSEVGVYGGASSAEREVREWTRGLRADIARAAAEGLPKHASLALAVVTLGGLLLFSASTSLRSYRPALPRHARPLPLVAQGGVAGRAAVLAEDTTHRGLVLLEQRDAFEEQAAELLGEPRPIALGVVAELLARRGVLPPDRLAAFRRAEVLIGRVERAVSSSSPLRVSKRDVLLVDDALGFALGALHEYGRTRS